MSCLTPVAQSWLGLFVLTGGIVSGILVGLPLGYRLRRPKVRAAVAYTRRHVPRVQVQ